MKRKFVRDVELHGHHRDCDCAYPMSDLHGSALVCALHENWYGNRECTCMLHDDDDWYAAGDAMYDQWKEEGGERNQRSSDNP
jgi:hypothetical protein